MIDIKGIKVPESLFSAIDEVYEESRAISGNLPKEALELLDKNRTRNTTTIKSDESTNQKPKI